MGDDFMGPYASPEPAIVVLANLSWFLFPMLIIYRMWRYPHPFMRGTGDTHLDLDLG